MRKSLVIAFLIAVIIGGLILVSAVHFGTVKASTDISGIISSDTTWTKANSPYTFTGPVAVNANVILTIEAGVTVNIVGNYYLQVNGTLYARGTSTDPIYINGNTNSYNPTNAIIFTSLSSNWNDQTSTGCIIENAVLTSIPIAIENTSPKINKNDITFNSSNVYPRNAISIGSGSPLISNNSVIVKGNGFQCTGISTGSGSPIISNNTIRGVNCFAGSGVYCGGQAYVSDNSISGWATGISAGSDAVVERNLIFDNTPVMGFSVGCGIEIRGGLVQNNTVFSNPRGISINFPSSMIRYNNIYGNQYNVYLPLATNVNATYNWWGTTDPTAINQTIYDFKNNFNLGNVTFIPFLTALNPAAPVIPTFTISASAGPGGSISPSGSVSVTYGSNQTFLVTPNTDYQIVSVLMDGSPATAPYTFSNVVANGHTISVTFQAIPVIPEITPLHIFATLMVITMAIILFKRRFESGVLKQKTGC